MMGESSAIQGWLYEKRTTPWDPTLGSQRYTQPEKDLQLLLYQLNLTLPEQPPPRLEDLKKKCGADL